MELLKFLSCIFQENHTEQMAATASQQPSLHAVSLQLANTAGLALSTIRLYACPTHITLLNKDF